MHMGRGKPRAEKRRITGAYSIDTGTAAIVADPSRDGGFTLEVNNVPSSYGSPARPRCWSTTTFAGSPSS